MLRLTLVARSASDWPEFLKPLCVLFSQMFSRVHGGEKDIDQLYVISQNAIGAAACIQFRA